MLKKLRVLFGLSLGLSCLLAACGNNAESAPARSYQYNSHEAITTLKQLEYLLNAGEVLEALDLFDDMAEIVEMQPTFLTFDDSEGQYQRQLSYGERITYRNRVGIMSYLFAQMYNKFHSTGSSYSEDEDKGIWQAQVALYDSSLQMKFKATTEAGKIKFLTVSNLNVVNN